ncbi:MAG: O-antigen ligase family protein [Candidatus Aminicenantes bacterium]|nr:O-antigen ligase family protein [Candidatus Aminicenantes bacterium]
MKLIQTERFFSSLMIPVFIGLFLLFSLISISISQIFLGLALFGWIVFQIKEKRKAKLPLFFWFLIAYIVLSLVSSILSRNPGISFVNSRDLLLFLVVPIVYFGFSRVGSLKQTNRVLLASFFISALYSLFYFFFKAVPGERITGFMGHWMTQAGLLLLFCTMALSLFFFCRNKWRFAWGAGFLLALPLIVLTLTRNSWIGLFVAIVAILILYKPKTLFIFPVAVVLFFLVSPKPIKDRALSIFDLKNTTNQQRFEYWQAGIKIIKDYPLQGTGPDMVDMVFQNPKYGLSQVARSNVHLHNNFLQIAAERGLFTLAAWIGFLVVLFVSLIRLLKQRDPAVFPYAAAALAALTGLVSAGLFEYNFGDSEVVVLFLYIISVPFALERIQKHGD